jgi:hypothetical protein
MRGLRGLLGLVAVIAWLGAAPAKKTRPPPNIVISTHVERTAVWVGDTFDYFVEAVHNRDLEFVLENLKKENLSLPPFAIRAVAVEQGEWTGGKRVLRLRLTLAAYESGKSELQIPSFPLYYFKRDHPAVKREAAAEAIQVPPTRVALRSTLGGGPPKLREFKPFHRADWREAIVALALGAGLAGLVVFRMGGWVWRLARRERPRVRRPSRRSRGRLVREELSRLRTLSAAGPERTLEFYRETSLFLRRYLSETAQLEAEGLTPAEIEAALRARGRDGALASELRAVLEECDGARYRPGGWEPASERRDEVLGRVERLVRARGLS